MCLSTPPMSTSTPILEKMKIPLNNFGPALLYGSVLIQNNNTYTMKKKSFLKKQLALIVAFLVLALPGFAQEPMQFSLEGARQHALEYNKNMVNAGLSTQEAQARLWEAIANGLPQINATLDYSNFFGSKASLGAMPGFEIEFNPTSNLSISLGQLIFSGNYIVGIQMAKLYQEVTQTSLEKTELDIIQQVSQAYFLVLISQQSKELVEGNLANMRDILEKTRTMVYAGVAEELDYDQLAVQVSMLSNTLRSAERQLELAFNMLRVQMGLTADTEIVLTDKLEDIALGSDLSLTLSKSFSLNNNPDFRLLKLQTDLAEKQVNMERAAYLPSLTGFYSYTEKLLKPEFDIQPKHVIGVNMNVPIFSSGVRRAKVSQARINLEMTQNQQELVAEQLLIQEKQLRFNLNNAIEQYESEVSNLEVARRVYQNMNIKYGQGMVSSLDLITANSNYLQAEGSYINSIFQLLEASLALNKLLNNF